MRIQLKNKIFITFLFILVIFIVPIYINNRVNKSSNIIFNRDLYVSSVPEIQWNYTWGGLGSDYGYAVAVDSLGNAYVTGYSSSFTGGDTDVCLVKFNSSGLVWNYTWGGNENDIGVDLALDSLGNAYVAGRTDSYGAGNGDVCLVKFNSTGVEWNYTWGGSETDFGNGIALDGLGNAYVAGGTASFGAINGDICLVKFNSTGVEWNYTWGGGGSDYGLDVALDLYRNAYVAGNTNSFGAINGDMCLIKFNSGGKEWNYTWGGGGNDGANGIILDVYHNAYVSGTTNSFGARGADLCLVKFNSNGELLWNYSWGGGGDEGGFDVALDDSNNAYVIGQTSSFGSINWDVCLVKFNSSGVVLNHTWGGIGVEFGYGIDVDSSDGIYFCGVKSDFGPSNEDMFLIKLRFTTSDETTKNPPDFLTLIIIGAVIGLVGVLVFTMLGIISSKRKRVRTIHKPKYSIEEIEVFRGGDWTIEAGQSIFQYKIKIKNSSHYVISNIQAIITSIPPGLELLSEKSYKYSDLRQYSFISPTFKFKATESCVGNVIESLVSFRDFEGQIQTINVEPFEIKYVCNLLVPKPISKQEYEQNIARMNKKEIEIDCDMSPEEIEQELSNILWDNNFYVLDKEPEPLGSEIRSLEGYAAGKYDNKDVALSVMMQKVAAQTTKLFVKAMSDREEKVIDLLKDINLKCDDLKSSNELILEYSQKIEQVLDEIDNLEEFLMKRLGSSWDRIKDVWEKYKNGEVGKSEFIKLGVKLIGKSFIKIFLGKIL